MKTLTTLALAAMMAASGVAMADNPLNVPTMDNFYAGSFSFSFEIPDFESVAANSILAAYWGSDSYNPDSNIFMLQNTEGVVKLVVGRGNLDAQHGFIEWHGSDYKTIDVSLATGVVYTISTIGADQNQTVTLSADNITPVTVNYAGNMVGGDQNTTMSSLFNETFAVTTSGDGSVPEPTTATLSLLALAGLAARRRRK